MSGGSGETPGKLRFIFVVLVELQRVNVRIVLQVEIPPKSRTFSEPNIVIFSSEHIYESVHPYARLHFSTPTRAPDRDGNKTFALSQDELERLVPKCAMILMCKTNGLFT